MNRVEASLFPMETQDPDAVINRSIDVLKSMGVACKVGPVSTEFSADDEQVWECLRAAYEAARQQGGEVAMTVTITNAKE